MKFLVLGLLLVAVIATPSGASSRKCRGVAPPAPVSYIKYLQASPQHYAAASESAAFTYARGQPVQKAVAVQPQQQYYNFQPQYEHQVAKAAASPLPARPQFSLANDVSSFQYSSPYVAYNNLGLLSQVVGKIGQATPVQQTKVAAPVVYQAPISKPAAAGTPIQYVPQHITYSQIQAAAPQLQKSVAADPATQQYVLAGSPQQTYAAQSIPQALYSPAPQYYTPEQVTRGVTYAQ